MFFSFFEFFERMKYLMHLWELFSYELNAFAHLITIYCVCDAVNDKPEAHQKAQNIRNLLSFHYKRHNQNKTDSAVNKHSALSILLVQSWIYA